jgi:hypothetical protein
MDIKSIFTLEGRKVDYMAKTEGKLTDLGVQRDIRCISHPQTSRQK